MQSTPPGPPTNTIIQKVHEKFWSSLDSDPDQAELIRLNRGIDPSKFSDHICTPNLASRVASFEALRESFSPEELEAAGTHEREVGGELIPAGALLRATVFFRYMGPDRTTLYVRAHKRNCRGVKHQPFGLDRLQKGDVAAIVEGEFKAIALWSLGMPAISSPGTSAFVGERFEVLKRALKRAQVRQVTIVFDNADQVSEYLEGGRANPKFKEDEARRYGVERDAIKLGRRLEVARVEAGYARLPRSARVDGEADVDGSLIARRLTAGKLRDLLTNPLDESAFREAIGAAANASVTKALHDGELRRRGCEATWTRPGLRLVVEHEPKKGNRKARLGVRVFLGARETLTDDVPWSSGKSWRTLAEEVGETLDLPTDSVLALFRDFREEIEEPPASPDGDGSVAEVLGRMYCARAHDIAKLEVSKGIFVPVQVCNRRIRLVREIRVGGRDQRRFYEIRVDGGARPATLQLAHRAVATTRTVLEALHEVCGADLQLSPEHATSVIKALQEIDKPECVEVPGHTGWDANGRYHTPSVIIHDDGRIEERRGPFYVAGFDEDVREHIRREGRTHRWMRADLVVPPETKVERESLNREFFDAFLAAYEQNTVLLLLSVYVLSIIVGRPDAGLEDLRSGLRALFWLHGPTSSGKTTATRYALCLQGYYWAPGSLVDGGASNAFLDDISDHLRNAVLAIDDLAGKGKSEQQVIGAIMRWADGSDRGRALKSGRARLEKILRSIYLITTEGSPPGPSAAQARVASFEHGGHKNDFGAYAYLDVTGPTGPQVGADFVSFVVRRTTVRSLRTRLDKLKKLWLGLAGLGPNHGRVSEAMAQLSLAAETWFGFMVESAAMPRLEADLFIAGFYNYLVEQLPLQLRRVTNLRESQEVLRRLYQLDASRGDVIAVRIDGRYVPRQGGTWAEERRTDLVAFENTDASELIVLLDVALRRLRVETGWKSQNGKMAIARELREDGLLLPARDGRLDRDRQINGRRVKAFVLDLNRVETRLGGEVELDEPDIDDDGAAASGEAEFVL